MLKLSLIAGLVGATLGALALNAGPASAQAVCLNPYAGAVSLSHDDMEPNVGFGYDKSFVDSQLARGNRCPDQATTQQSTPFIPYNQRVPQAQRNKTGRSYY